MYLGYIIIYYSGCLWLQVRRNLSQSGLNSKHICCFTKLKGTAWLRPRPLPEILPASCSHWSGEEAPAALIFTVTNKDVHRQRDQLTSPCSFFFFFLIGGNFYQKLPASPFTAYLGSCVQSKLIRSQKDECP